MHIFLARKIKTRLSETINLALYSENDGILEKASYILIYIQILYIDR